VIQRPRVGGLFQRQDAWWTTQFCDGVRDADVLSVRHDADFGFEDAHVELEQNLACDFLLEELGANCVIKASDGQPVVDVFDVPFAGVDVSRPFVRGQVGAVRRREVG